MREARHSPVIVLWLVAVTAVVQVVVLGHDRDDPLVITDVTREETRDVDRNFVDDTYRATLRHTGREDTRDFAGVTASIAQPFNLPIPGIVRVVDGDLTFGAVRAGESVESTDTVTIRRHRSQRLEARHLRWSIDGRPDVVLPDVWAGTWRFTLTYMDGETNEISQVSEITGVVPSGAPLGLSLLPKIARCDWDRTDTALHVSCGALARVDGCFAQATARFDVARSDANAQGHGEWRITHTGSCGDFTDVSAAVDIDGTRLSEDIEPEPVALGFMTSFVTLPGFSALIADGIRNVTRDEPDSERACTRGGWHRFMRPFFVNEHACRELFRTRHADAGDWRR